MTGVVIKSTGSWYEVRDDKGEILNCRLRGVFKNDKLKLTNPIAVGDKVDFEVEDNLNTAVITEILPRKNYIIRKSSRKKHFAHIIAANIDKAVLFITLKSPRTSTGFINRFLASAESFRIPVIIVFNKIDIYRKQEITKMQELFAIYEPLGYKCFKTSLLNNEGIEQIKNEILNQTILIAGHSGVGKSSLLNLMDANLNLPTGGLTKFTDKGSHTTTFAQMYPFGKGYVIDTPGIKEFGLENISAQEVSHYFPEMRDLLGECKYNNCMHINEPQCAVLKNVEEGKIDESRYLTYLTLVDELENPV